MGLTPADNNNGYVNDMYQHLFEGSTACDKMMFLWQKQTNNLTAVRKCGMVLSFVMIISTSTPMETGV
jgi:hypothetical protein